MKRYFVPVGIEFWAYRITDPWPQEADDFVDLLGQAAHLTGKVQRECVYTEEEKVFEGALIHEPFDLDLTMLAFRLPDFLTYQLVVFFKKDMKIPS